MLMKLVYSLLKSIKFTPPPPPPHFSSNFKHLEHIRDCASLQQSISKTENQTKNQTKNQTRDQTEDQTGKDLNPPQPKEIKPASQYQLKANPQSKETKNKPGGLREVVKEKAHFFSLKAGDKWKHREAVKKNLHLTSSPSKLLLRGTGGFSLVGALTASVIGLMVTYGMTHTLVQTKLNTLAIEKRDRRKSLYRFVDNVLADSQSCKRTLEGKALSGVLGNPDRSFEIDSLKDATGGTLMDFKKLMGF